jgi:hypothetical protein
LSEIAQETVGARVVLGAYGFDDVVVDGALEE